MLDKYLLPEQEIAGRIHVFRHQKVMMDYDLALLYEIPTKRINEQVKRNIDRFPKDFTCLPDRQVFQLTQNEWGQLRSQFATANSEMRRDLQIDAFDSAQSAVCRFLPFDHPNIFQTKPKIPC